MWHLVARIIPHKKQRYETVGDWVVGKRGKPHQLYISSLGNEDYEFLVLLHELVEFWLCRKRGITQECVDAWDKAFPCPGEPGEDPAAPYHKEHMFATRVERLVCREMGIPWKQYDQCFDQIHADG